MFYFPDLANKKIYTKQINYDGTSTLNVYEYKPIANDMTPQYVTRATYPVSLYYLCQQTPHGTSALACNNLWGQKSNY